MGVVYVFGILCSCIFQYNWLFAHRWNTNKRLKSQITSFYFHWATEQLIFPFKALAMDHRNLVSTAGVPVFTEVKQSGLKCQIFTPSRRNDREGKKACFEKDWCQGTGEQLYWCSGADDAGCLGNRFSLPVALNCPTRQWTIISAG